MSSPNARRNEAVGASNDLGGQSSTVIDPLADLVAGCREDDREAQQKLFEACQLGVYRLMVRMVGEQDAPDLTQQAFLQVFRKIDSFHGRSQFRTWLYRLAVNEALQHLRRRRGKDDIAIQYDVQDPGPSHERCAEHKESLEQGLSRLAPLLRSVFLLREVEDMSYREIAAAMDISEGTVASRLNRARAELKKHLLDLGWEL